VFTEKHKKREASLDSGGGQKKNVDKEKGSKSFFDRKVVLGEGGRYPKSPMKGGWNLMENKTTSDLAGEPGIQ